MHGTSSETFVRGRRSESGTGREPEPGRTPLLLLPSPPPPPQLEESLSLATSCGQSAEPGGSTELNDLTHQNKHRPSVLRQATLQASRLHPEKSSLTQPVLIPESEIQGPGPSWWSSPPAGVLSPGRVVGSSSPLLWFPSRRGEGPRHSFQHARHNGLWVNSNIIKQLGCDENTSRLPSRCSSALPTTGGARGLFVSGLCHWPECDRSFEDFSSFLIHLHGEHSLSEQSLTQYRVQQDMVHYLEKKLTVERQRLRSMQQHISDSSSAESAAYDWSYSLALYLTPPPVTDGLVAPPGVVKDVEDSAQHGCWPSSSVHLLPDCVPSMEYYKYNNIRPPYTYAFLIRWSILESPSRQRSLNEIYTWFSTMFFYFRHNTATWKNAVRHNLSLHTCFVRVEAGKGAVWTVDESEYQRRKGQKCHRDHPGLWMSPYSHFRPGES